MRRLTSTLIALSALAIWSNTASAQVPYTQNFEGATVCTPFPSCAGLCNITASTNWTNFTDPGANYDWHPHQGTTGPNTGPSVDHTLGTSLGKFLFIESSGCNALQAVSVQTPVLTFAGVTNPQVEYWVHHNGTGFTTSGVETQFWYSTNGGGSFTQWAPATVSGNLGTNWNLVTVNCGPSGLNVGNTANLVFRIRHIRNNNGFADAAIDDFRAYALLQYDARVDVSLDPPTTPPSAPAEYYYVPAGLGPVSTPIDIINNGYDSLHSVIVTYDIVGTVDVAGVESGVFDNGGAGYNMAPGEVIPVNPNWNPSADADVTTFGQTFTLCANIFSAEADLDLTNNQDCVQFRRHEDTYRRDSGTTINGWVFNPGFPGYWAVAYDFPYAGAFITGGSVVVGADPFNAPPIVGSPVRVDLLSYNAATGFPGPLIEESEETIIQQANEHEVYCPYPGGYLVTTPGIYVAAYFDVNNSGPSGLTANWISTADDIYAPGRFWYGYPVTAPTWFNGTPGGELAMWRVRFKVACAGADAGRDTSFCVGGSAVLGGNPTANGPNGPFTYAWSPAAYVDDPTAANPTATPPLGSTTFTVQVTDATGCIVLDDVTITTFPYDNVQFVGLLTNYCVNDPPSALAGNPPGGSSPVGTSPGTSWNWSQAMQEYTGPPVPMPDAGGGQGDLIMTVSGVYGTAGPGNDLMGNHVFLDSVYIKGTHSWIGDVNIILESPNGTQVMTLDRPGSPPGFGCTADNFEYTIVRASDCPTCTDNETACPPVGNGRFIAHGGDDLSMFDNNTPANGDWHLLSNDFVGGDAGTMTDLILWFSPAAGGGTFDPAAAGAGTHDIIYCYTNKYGCEACDTQTTTVHPLPDASITPAGPFCVNEPNLFLTAATPGGQWSGPGVIGAFTGEWSAGAAGIGTHTIYYVVTDANGCTNNDSTQIVVRDVPIADAGPDYSICNGGSVQIGGSPTGTPGISFGGFIIGYSWSPNVGLSSSIDPNPTASPTVTTNYTVVVTDGNGCTASDDMVLTVYQNPVVDAGADVTVCNGDPATLGGSPTASGGTAPYSYDWQPGGMTVPNPTVNPATTTTYTVTVTDANGCIGSDAVTVIVNAAVVADAGADVATCAGTSIGIGGSPTATGGTAPYSYSWSPAGGLSSTTASNPSASPAITTTYTVTVTDANGCTDQDQVTVTIYPAVIANAGADETICNGGSSTIGGNPSAIAGTPPYTYTWSPNAYLDNNTIANPTSTPPSTMNYTLTVTDANGCTDSDDMVLTVAANPVVDAGQDEEICAGSDAQIGGSPTASGGTPPYSYMWAPSNGLSSVSTANPFASPASTTTYTVTVTDANGCTGSDVVTVTVNAGPTAHAGIDVDLCIGESAVIGGFPAASGGTPPYSYLWTPIADLSDYAAANPIASPIVTTVYTLTVDDANGCVDVDSMTVTVHPLPVVTITGLLTDYCVDTSQIQLTGNPTGGFWVGPGVFGSVFFPDAAGPGTHMIVYTYTDQWGCTNSDTAFTTVHALPVVFAGFDTQIYKGDSVVLQATVTGDGPFIYSWTATPHPPGHLDDNDPTTKSDLDDGFDVLNPLAMPEVFTTYVLTATDIWGCSNSDDVWVDVNPNTPIPTNETTPNLFTPEPQDGVNDTWIIPLLDHFPDNHVTIYNRWGQVVYEATNYSRTTAWDGGDLPAGTYFYVLTAADTANQQVNQLIHRGSVTIVRHDVN
jgi:gliding motility-associated-like protein